MSDFSDRFHHHVPGLNNASAYMSSGHTYITGSAIVAEGDAWTPSGEVSGTCNTHTMHIKFPRVTKSFTVINTDEIFSALPPAAAGAGDGGFSDGGISTAGAIAVHFTPSASAIPGNHFLTIPNSGDSFTFDVKCKEVFITNIEQGSGGTALAQTQRSASFQLIAELTSIPAEEMYFLTGSGITEWEGIHS